MHGMREIDMWRGGAGCVANGGIRIALSMTVGAM
jgi:hypothetical protein